MLNYHDIDGSVVVQPSEINPTEIEALLAQVRNKFNFCLSLSLPLALIDLFCAYTLLSQQHNESFSTTRTTRN